MTSGSAGLTRSYLVQFFLPGRPSSDDDDDSLQGVVHPLSWLCCRLRHSQADKNLKKGRHRKVHGWRLGCAHGGCTGMHCGILAVCSGSSASRMFARFRPGLENVDETESHLGEGSVYWPKTCSRFAMMSSFTLWPFGCPVRGGPDSSSSF